MAAQIMVLLTNTIIYVVLDGQMGREAGSTESREGGERGSERERERG